MILSARAGTPGWISGPGLRLCASILVIIKTAVNAKAMRPQIAQISQIRIASLSSVKSVQSVA
jgi:hypothetical protein